MSPAKTSVTEFDAAQVAFNTALRIFMKSPAGDAAELVERYAYLKKERAALSPAVTTDIITVPTFDYGALAATNPAYHLIVFLRQKLRPIEKHIHSCIIHGSYATQDAIPGWSDLDTMIILKDQVFDSADILRSVQKVFLKAGLLCYWIDPLAHHQLSFITEFDLGYYPQSFLPLPAYARGLRLFGPEHIRFDVRDDAVEQTTVMEKYRNRFKRKVARNAWSQNQYDWKNDLAHAFLLPSLLLQTKGVYVYKKESFDLLPQFFPGIDQRPLKEAADLMKKWKVRNLVRYLPPWLVTALPYRLSRIIVEAARKPALGMSPTTTRRDREWLTKEFLRLYDYGIH